MEISTPKLVVPGLDEPADLSHDDGERGTFVGTFEDLLEFLEETVRGA